MNTPKRPLSAADHSNHSTTSSCSPPPTKRAKPNTHHRQNGSAKRTAVAGGNATDKPAWLRPIESLLDAFKAIVSTPSTASPSSTATVTVASGNDESISFRIKDSRDHTRTRDQLEHEITALKNRREHLKRQYGHQVIAARRSHSTVPDKPRELAEIPKRISHLRHIATTARRDDNDDMPRRANGAKQDGKGHGQNAPLAYARRQPMGKKEVRVVPNRTALAVHGPELTVTQPRSAPTPQPHPLPVLAHPFPLILPTRSPHASAVTDERLPRRRRTPSPPPSPSPPPPMGPSENPHPPWAPTWDPTATRIPKSCRSTATRPNQPPSNRLKQVRAKVKARDESDIECLASAQPPAGVAASSRPSFFPNFDDDDSEYAPEADEDAPIFDVYQQEVNAALSQEEAAWNGTSTPLSQSRSQRHGQRKIFPADLLRPSPNDLGSELSLVRPPYAPNYVTGTSSFSDYTSATRPRKLFHARDSLAPAAAAIRRRRGGADDDDDLLERTTDRFRSVLDIARKSEQEITPERNERYQAYRAKREEDEREAQRILESSKVKAVKKRRFPAKLSKEHAKTVQEIFSNRNYETSIKGAAAAFRDMNRLNGQDWLNDELINYYGVMINNRSDAADAREKANNEPDPRGVGEERVLQAFCFNTNFFTMFCQSGFAKVKRWTRRFDTFEKDIIIIPVNHSNMHWCCAAVNIKEKRFEYYDSMGKPRDFVYQALRKWLKEEHKSRKGTEIDLSDWEDYWDPEIPRQANADDCGVFTCMFMESLSRDCAGFDFNQKNMPYLRRRIALEIDKGELLNLEEFV